MAGGRAGADGVRGSLFGTLVDRILRLRPKAFILENVVGPLTIDKGQVLVGVVDKLE